MFSLLPHQPHPFLIHPIPKLPLSLDGQKSSIEVISVTGNNCFELLFCFHLSSFPGDSDECCPAVLAMPSTSNALSIFLPLLIP